MPSPVRLAWAEVPAGTGRRAVAWRLIGELAPGARITNVCPRCGGPHGAVRLSGVPARASIAYAGGFALAGVVDCGVADAVGIDAERGRPRDAAGLARVLDAGRPATLGDWVRVEAVLKADGRGLRVDPAEVAVTVSGAGAWTARVPGSPHPYSGWDVPGPDGTAVAVAIRAASGARARRATR